MTDKEREIWIGKNRLYLGEDNIFHVIADGDIDEEMAITCKEFVLNFSNIIEYKGKKINTLVDINKAGKHSSKARKVWKELVEHENAGKIAFYGMHPVARVIASFVMGVAKKKDMRFFKTEEEALAWLKE